MRELVLKISMSADGFVGGPGGELDWIFRSLGEDAAEWIVGTLEGASLHLMGSRTFRGMVAWWPKSKEPFAFPMNRIPKAVFSSNRDIIVDSISAALADAGNQDESPASAQPNAMPPDLRSWAEAQVLNGDVTEEVLRLKQDSGAYILAHGGASFVRDLISADLVDEYRLLIHPVALGHGQSIFSDLDHPKHMHLREVKRFDGGTIAAIYRRA